MLGFRADVQGHRVVGHGRASTSERYLASMSQIGDQIHTYIDAEDAVRLVSKYYSGVYTGSRFDTADQLKSPDPNRFTAHDVAAVATLSVPLPGSAVVGLLVREERLAELLAEVPTDLDLVEADEKVIGAVFAVQDELDNIDGIAHVTRSKLLAHKRPRLVPIRDQYVLTALIGRAYGPLTLPLRKALMADSSITDRLNEVRRMADIPAPISTLRMLDVVVWMATHGDSQVIPDVEGAANS